MLQHTLHLFKAKSYLLEVILITPEQNKLLGQLLTAGVPLPIALPIAMDPQAAKAGIADGITLFEEGTDAILNVIPTLAKKAKRRRSRSAKASDKKLSMAFKEANARYRKKDGSLRAGRTQADIARLAHKLRKKM